MLEQTRQTPPTGGGATIFGSQSLQADTLNALLSLKNPITENSLT